MFAIPTTIKANFSTIITLHPPFSLLKPTKKKNASKHPWIIIAHLNQHNCTNIIFIQNEFMNDHHLYRFVFSWIIESHFFLKISCNMCVSINRKLLLQNELLLLNVRFFVCLFVEQCDIAYDYDNDVARHSSISIQFRFPITQY